MLDSTTCAEHDGKVYCKNCHSKKFGPKGYGFGGGAGALSTETGAQFGNTDSEMTLVWIKYICTGYKILLYICVREASHWTLYRENQYIHTPMSKAYLTDSLRKPVGVTFARSVLYSDFWAIHMQASKVQISLCIHNVWLGSLLFHSHVFNQANDESARRKRWSYCISVQGYLRGMKTVTGVATVKIISNISLLE